MNLNDYETCKWPHISAALVAHGTLVRPTMKSLRETFDQPRGDTSSRGAAVDRAPAKGGKETCKGYDRDRCFGQSDALNFGDL